MLRSALRVLSAVALAGAALAACSDDGGSSEPAGASAFAFGTDPAQPLSAAPFPNDLYLGADGRVALAPLADDPVLGTLAKPLVLANLDAAIAGRPGFGFTSGAFFFLSAAPDVASFEGRVTFETLAGPEAGTSIPAQVFGWPHADLVGALPAWGHYLVPGSTYAVVIRAGVRTADGEPIAAPRAFRDLLGDAAPAGADKAYAAFAPLRAWIAGGGAAVEDLAVATVFTAEESLPHLRKLFDLMDAAPLTPPDRRVRYAPADAAFVEAAPVDGAALDAYFGVPEGPLGLLPGKWGEGSRKDAAQLPDGNGAPYSGGTLHARIGMVLNGSLRMPAPNFSVVGGEPANTGLREAGGAIVSDLDAMIPFSLYLCDDQVADPSDLPVALFTHGGTAIRSDAVAFANVNCLSGVATLTVDNPFHGGRAAVALVDGVLVPTRPDAENEYSGTKEGDAGFVPDHIGDNAGAIPTAGGFFGLGVDLSPGPVEANLMMISAEQWMLLRYVREGDWSQVLPGLSFDGGRVLHQSLSWGTSFTTGFQALADDLLGVVNSVGSGMILSANIPVAPSNADLAAGIMPVVLGTPSSPQDLKAGAWRDPIVALHQWLTERGDPLAYAPYVARHRPSERALDVLSSGDSWDETLFGPAQLSFNAALGLQVFRDGADWTLDPSMPGADTVAETAFPAGPVAGNATFAGRARTAAISYLARSCHGQVVGNVCKVTRATPHPPALPLDEPVVAPSPICALQHQVRAFTDSLLAGAEHGEVVPPEGTCADLYAQ